MIALLALLSARAETLVLEVGPAAMPYGVAQAHDTLWLGTFSTMSGRPRLGRLERCEGGAHLVVPMIARARILPDAPAARGRPAALARIGSPAGARGAPGSLAPPRIAGHAGALAVPSGDAEITVRVEPVRFDGRVGLQTGARAAWTSPSAGVELGGYDTEVGRASGSVTEIPHELGFWIPDDAWGPQSVRMVYTIAPW